MTAKLKTVMKKKAIQIMREVYYHEKSKADSSGEPIAENELYQSQVDCVLNSDEFSTSDLLNEVLHVVANTTTKKCITNDNVSGAIQKTSGQGSLDLGDELIMKSVIEDAGEIHITQNAPFAVLFRQSVKWNNNVAIQMTAHARNMEWFQQVMDSPMASDPSLTYGQVFGKK